MPLGFRVRYRFKRLKEGKAIRLAFRQNKIVEVSLFQGRPLKKKRTLYKIGRLNTSR